MSGYNDEDLAYGEDNRDRGYGGQGGQGTSDRGLVGDALRKLKTKYQQSSFGQPQSGPSAQQYYGQSGPPGVAGSNQGYGTAQTTYNQGNQPYGQENQPPYKPAYPLQQQQQQQQQQRPDIVSKLFGGLQGTVQSIGSDVAGLLGTHYQPQQQQQQSQYGGQGPSTQGNAQNRFESFASEKNGNDVKWFVDGCGYMWAVSRALESAKQSIWILDWWLSPELYLRRPPSLNEQWRLDRTLQRAAQRGVKVNIIVYKEVPQALSLSSVHTKRALEALHPNIAVFRHPDHLPDVSTAQSSLLSAFQGLQLDAKGQRELGDDSLRGLYGIKDDQILFWAHHEKLLIVDSNFLFMGGLDLCFGRWDTNQHSIADVHPEDLNMVMFPGQDYNNGRILDFNDVAQPFQNKVDRTQSSRMGWSDISISLQGPCVRDLCFHFINRWNFIFDEKYNRGDPRYYRLAPDGRPLINSQAGARPGNPTQPNYQPTGPTYIGGVPQFPPPPGNQASPQPPWQPTPHTPQPTQTQGQIAPQAGNQAQWQSGSRPHTPEPPHPQAQLAPYGSHQAQFQPGSRPHTPEPQQTQTIPYGPNQPTWQPASAHTPDPIQQQPQQSYVSGQPTYHAYQPPGSHTSKTEPYYPPPPPGPPPATQQYQSSPPTTASTQQQQYPGPSPISPTAPYQFGGDYGSDAHGHGSQGYQASGHVAELPTQQYRQVQSSDGQVYPPDSEGTRGIYDEENPDYSGERKLGSKFDRYRKEGHQLGSELGNVGSMIGGQLQQHAQRMQGTFFGGTDQYGRPLAQLPSVMSCQVVRSCTKWSNGTPTEHSVQNAYIQSIAAAQHFIYIENQFFITATGNDQHPVRNQVGKALLDRILRAARAGEPFKVMVVIPSVPGFAGDLHSNSSLGTRAIMEYQYNSINRGGHSIMQSIANAGYNPLDYIRFYNLRNYDRINASSMMRQIEQQSGVGYEDARRQHDDFVGAGYGGQGEGTGVSQTNPGAQYQQYQAAAQKMKSSDNTAGLWDSVASCYMLNGKDIRTVPWSGDEASEIHAFVSEELYIHSKVMIVDDRTVICGSANLNDRSMLGDHDSEIALVIQDPSVVPSYMGGRQWQASRFGSSLRRQLFRKHLGLLHPQDPQRPDKNFEPVGVPNIYDWGSPEDNLVTDPLAPTFQALWNTRARTNTDIFRKVFHVVPDDDVTSWVAYKEFYEYYFRGADANADGKGGTKQPPRYQWGHVVAEDFPGGVREVKELLSQIKGTIVEMPLCFLQDERDIAKQGLTLNPLTDVIYT